MSSPIQQVHIFRSLWKMHESILRVLSRAIRHIRLIKLDLFCMELQRNHDIRFIKGFWPNTISAECEYTRYCSAEWKNKKTYSHKTQNERPQNQKKQDWIQRDVFLTVLDCKFQYAGRTEIGQTSTFAFCNIEAYSIRTYSVIMR